MNPDINPEYDHDRPWYDQPKNFAGFTPMKEPFEHIIVGSHPTDGLTMEMAQSIDDFVNVSGTNAYMLSLAPSRLRHQYYWYPLPELSAWGYGPFLWSKRILDHLYEEGETVYLHCAAGAGRSPTIAMAWLISQGYTFFEAGDIAAGNKSDTFRAMRLDAYLHLRVRHFVPSIADLREFYRRYEEHPQWELDSYTATEKKRLVPLRKVHDRDKIIKELITQKELRDIHDVEFDFPRNK